MKVLDFGLAKAFQSDASDPSMSQSPTISLTAAATQMGMVIGTPAYMAPEQAKGHPADKRADIWAFGAVLFEMLTGKKLFEAGDVSEMLASVLVKDPDISAISIEVPAHLRSVIRHCLVKDPKSRLRDIGDVRLAMEGTFETTVSAPADPTAAPQFHVWQRPWAILAAIVTAVLVTALAVSSLERPSRPRVTRFSIPASSEPPGPIDRTVALSRDGRTLVYSAREDGEFYIHQRPMGQSEALRIRDTENSGFPFISPDGDSVGFYNFTTLTLDRVSLTGGPATTLTSAAAIQGASWGPNGGIVYAAVGSGLWLVPEGGGDPEQIAEKPPGQDYRDPTFVPNGESLLFTVSLGRAQPSQIAVLPLDGGEPRILLEGSSPTLLSTGHLLFIREDTLFAAPFDLSRLDVTGVPVPVLPEVDTSSLEGGRYAVAEDGTLAYVQNRGPSMTPSRTLGLMDRMGAVERLDLPPNRYLAPRLSPDGRSVAVQTDSERSDIWVYDLEGDTAIRQLTLENNNVRPLWTPDGDYITFASDRDGSFSIYRQRADGGGVTERLTTAEAGTVHWPEAWSPDGSTLVFRVEEPTGGRINGVGDPRDLWTLTLGNAEQPRVLAAAPQPTGEMGASFSPDGQWVAYTSGTVSSFDFDVYVEPFPATGEKYRISQEQGVMPLWSRAGNELFYRPVATAGGDAQQTLKSVSVSTGPPFRWGSEQPVSIGSFISTQFYRSFDLTPDGQRFLVVLPEEEPDDAGRGFRIEIVQDWVQELTERVPVP